MTERRAPYLVNADIPLNSSIDYAMMVDKSAEHILRDYLMERRRALLTELRKIEKILDLEPKR